MDYGIVTAETIPQTVGTGTFLKIFFCSEYDILWYSVNYSWNLECCSTCAGDTTFTDILWGRPATAQQATLLLVTRWSAKVTQKLLNCRAGWGSVCPFPLCGWFEWPSSGVVGFYDHEPSWCSRLTSLLCLVAFSWLSARPMHVVDHFTSW